jgi:hypothetical protein
VYPECSLNRGQHEDGKHPIQYEGVVIYVSEESKEEIARITELWGQHPHSNGLLAPQLVPEQLPVQLLGL